MHAYCRLSALPMTMELNLMHLSEFNFSPKWLNGFKKAHGINRVCLHGEGAAADLLSVEIVRKE